MARGEYHTVLIESIATGGAGLARLNGKSIFIELSAPGDLLRCRITKEHKNWAEAELSEILEPSAQRVYPVCPLYGRCGGCSLQHLAYKAQITAKKNILKDTFERIGGIKAPAIKTRSGEPFEYRNRVQFHCGSPGGGLQTGFRERKSSDLVSLEDCCVADAGIRTALSTGSIRPPPGKERFTVYSRGTTFLCEGETERGHVFILDRDLLVDTGVFFQSNAAMLELLLGDLLKAVSAANRNLAMADIYCGVGTFAAFLGGGFQAIHLVEENKTALSLARENVRGKKVNYYALAADEWAKKFDRGEEACGFVVMDPPREGLSSAIKEWLVNQGPELAIYISCDPATLARDCKDLLRGGYALKEITMYDFYPQTAHIESLAIFTRSNNEY